MIAEFEPKHPNANIHGMVGSNGRGACETQEGRMCTGCCTALHITRKGNENIVLKEAGQGCPAQLLGKGCAHVINGDPNNRFWVCKPYHCSGDLAKFKKGDPQAGQRILLCNAACLMNEEIGRQAYKQNLQRVGIA